MEPGDWIFVHQQNDPSGLGNARKTSLHRRGPYEVKEILNDRKVRIYLPGAVKGQPPPTEDVSRDRCYKAGPWDLSVQQTPLDFTQALRNKNWESVPLVNNNPIDVNWQDPYFDQSSGLNPNLMQNSTCPVSQQVGPEVPVIIQNPVPDPKILSEANKVEPSVKLMNSEAQTSPKILRSTPDLDTFRGLGASPQKEEAGRAELLKAAELGAQKAAEASRAVFKEYFENQKLKPSDYPHLVPTATYNNRQALIPFVPNATSSPKKYKDSSTSPSNIEMGARARELPVVPMEPLEIELDQDMNETAITESQLLLQNQQAPQALEHRVPQQYPIQEQGQWGTDYYRSHQDYTSMGPRQPQVEHYPQHQLGHSQQPQLEWEPKYSQYLAQPQQHPFQQSGLPQLQWSDQQRNVEYKSTYPVRLATREVELRQRPYQASAQDTSPWDWDSHSRQTSPQVPPSSYPALKACSCGLSVCNCAARYVISGPSSQHVDSSNSHPNNHQNQLIPPQPPRQWQQDAVARKALTYPAGEVLVESPGGTRMPYSSNHPSPGTSAGQEFQSPSDLNRQGALSHSGSYLRPLEYTGETPDINYPVVPRTVASQCWQEPQASGPSTSQSPLSSSDRNRQEGHEVREEPLPDLSPVEAPCPRAEALRARRDKAKESWKYERVEEPAEPQPQPRVPWKPRTRIGEHTQRFAKKQAQRNLFRIVKSQRSATAPVTAFHIPLQRINRFAPETSVFSSAAKYWKSLTPKAELLDPAQPLAKMHATTSAAILEDLRTHPNPVKYRRQGWRPRSPPPGSFSVFVAQKPAEGGDSQYHPVRWSGSAFLESGPASV